MAADGHGVERRGLMFVLSSPSGAGKTTLSRLLIERIKGLSLSVSTTTRPMRPGEVDGRDYAFVDKATFEAMVKRDELLEWATVFDNRYGTPRAPVEAALSAGRDVLFDIDWQGTQQLREKARADVVSVTIIVMMRDILVRVRWHLIDVTGGMDRELNARDASPRQIGGMGHAGEAGQDQHQACQERQKGSH